MYIHAVHMTYKDVYNMTYTVKFKKMCCVLMNAHKHLFPHVIVFKREVKD